MPDSSFARAFAVAVGLSISAPAAVFAQPEPAPSAPPPTATPVAPPTPPASATPDAPPPPPDKPATPEVQPPPPPPKEMPPSPPAPPPSKPAPAPHDDVPLPPQPGFSFGSYGRVVGATDLRGRPGMDSNIVAHGSRLDEADYVEIELHRDDAWKKTDSTTRLVVTLAVADPLFHYTGKFDIEMAVRNLYLEEHDLIAKGLSFWAGSRMYRGDDIYLLDWWPLDNLNTMGAGVRYDASTKTTIAAHFGVNQPDNGFFKQIVDRTNVYNQPGVAPVDILNRQQTIGSLRLQQVVPLSTDGAGIKGVLYGEYHQLAAGQEQTSKANVFQTVPADSGYVIGGQFGAFTGHRDTHVNLFVRYANGLAAYGEFPVPIDLAPNKTAEGAHEFLVALGANYEYGPVGVMLGAYLRSFRDASPGLDFNDVDEGIVVARPAVFFGEVAGLALEGSYQASQHGVLTMLNNDGTPTTSPTGPLTARLFRFGVMPFLSPAGRGDYSRPQFRIIYCASFRNQATKSLYPQDDVSSLRDIEHFLGVGAEWWFNSTSYGGS